MVKHSGVKAGSGNLTTESETPVMTAEEAFAAEAERIVCQSDRVAVSCVRAVLGKDKYEQHVSKCTKCNGAELCPEGWKIWDGYQELHDEAMSALRLTKRGLVR